MAHDVFISYSSKDKSAADAICTNLEGAGIRCWIAPRDIAAGEDWPTAITKAISQSLVMVLIFSANSNSSVDVSREIILAANNKLIIIPFKIEDIEPEPGKQYYLGRTHWLDAINPPTEKQIHALIDYVKAIIPIRQTSLVTPSHFDHPLPVDETSNKPASPPRPVKKVTHLIYLWTLILIFLLILVGWFFLTFHSSLLSTAHSATLTPSPIATDTAFATQLATWTSTPKPPVSEPLNWNVNVSDSFSSNENGWPVLYNSVDSCSTSSLNIQNGALLWAIDALPGNYCWYVYNPQIPSVSDFEAAADVIGSARTGKADYGIGFRIIDAENCYIFLISPPSQSFEVRRILNNSWTTLVNWTFASVIKTDGYNHLNISARGTFLNFYINGQSVGTIEDSGISSGYAGIVSEIFDGGSASISYKDFTLQGLR